LRRHPLKSRLSASLQQGRAKALSQRRLAFVFNALPIRGAEDQPDRIWRLRLPAYMRVTRTEGDTLAIEEGLAHFEVKAMGLIRIACNSA